MTDKDEIINLKSKIELLETELSKREDTSILLEAAREEIKRLGAEYLSIKNDYDFKVQQCEEIHKSAKQDQQRVVDLLKKKPRYISDEEIEKNYKVLILNILKLVK